MLYGMRERKEHDAWNYRLKRFDDQFTESTEYKNVHVPEPNHSPHLPHFGFCCGMTIQYLTQLFDFTTMKKAYHSSIGDRPHIDDHTHPFFSLTLPGRQIPT